MSEQARKFDCKEQRIKDLKKAVELIFPVVQKIKERKSKKKEHAKLNKGIDMEGKTIGEAYEEYLRVGKEIEQLNYEIEEYTSYACSFNYIDGELALEIFKSFGDNCSEDTFFAILLLIKNQGIRDDYQVDSIDDVCVEYASTVKDEFRKSILKDMDNFSTHCICDIIEKR